MTSDTKALLAKEQAEMEYPLLRMEAGEWLTPGPKAGQSCFWREGGRCYHGEPQRDAHGYSLKMCPGACDVPPRPAEGSIPDIAERLVKKCDVQSLVNAIFATWPTPNATSFVQWIKATPAERAACCIKALEQGEERR